MTGLDYRAEAERLAAESYHEDRFEKPEILLARAQVFATLAITSSVERIASLEDRIRRLEEADEYDGLADRIEAIERRVNGEVPW